MPQSNRLPSVPFPSSTPTHPLAVIDYALLLQQDVAEVDALWHACTNLGFFYLKNHEIDFQGVLDACEDCFENLSEDERKEYDVGVSQTTFGYKSIGYDNTDAQGNVDTNQQFNISRDDIISYPSPTHITYPSQITTRMHQLKEFTTSSRSVALTILSILEAKLGLEDGELRNLHREGPGFTSPSKARVIQTPPQAIRKNGDRFSIGEHTDFGTLTILDNNRTGGLQVLPPGTTEWQYVAPLENHIICNLADALTILSGGILKSNVHRVLPPPGDQRICTRWSTVFFLVPEYKTVLSPLIQSSLVAEASKTMTLKLEPGTTCQQWFNRRIYGVRAINRTGPESWLGSRGTEHHVSLNLTEGSREVKASA